MSWQQSAARHAWEHFPKEACGLIIVRKGREVYWPCKNLAERNDQFIIDHEDYATAEEHGEIIGVVHSHCNKGPEPSEADRVVCSRGKLTWHIIGLPTERWHTMQPDGYEAPLIGRPFQHGVLDCYALCRDWYRTERGIEIPDYERKDEWWLNGENLYLDKFRDAGFVENPELVPGSALLMQIASPVPNHAAIYIGDDMIIHHLQGRLSSRDVYGGYWRKVTVKVLRHARDQAVR